MSDPERAAAPETGAERHTSTSSPQHSSEFAELLSRLDRDPGETVAICSNGGGRFRPSMTTVADAPTVAHRFASGDCWYATAVLRPGIANGRGTADDTIGVRELFCDLDVKPGGVESYEVARAVIDDLSAMLTVPPVAVVASGHGLQPHWRLERDASTDWADGDLERRRAAVVMFRRWHRLVASVAERRGGSVDNVSDLARILRVPGTTNVKDPATPVAVTVEFPAGAVPVSWRLLVETLDAYGVAELVGDDDLLGEVVAPVATWTWATSGCGYVISMVNGWNSDTPTARHPWMVAQAVRVAAAHRLGCLTEDAHRRAVEALASRFRRLLDGAPQRGEAPGEVADALAWGQARVSTFPEARCRAELGHHEHAGGGDDLADELWNARPELARMRDFARARRVSPLAMIGATLVRIAAAVPPHVTLPPLVGGHVSLNLFIALVGASGDGKDAAGSAARDATAIDAAFSMCGAGSGEGIAHQFVTYVAPNPKAGEPGGLQQHTRSVIFNVAEIDTLAALKGRQASTLLPELRKAWMGDELGFAYVDRTKRLRLRAHMYRLGLIVGVQPERAAPLLDDADSGTPQRFLWLLVADPDAPDEAPPEPHAAKWIPPTWPPNTPSGTVAMRVCVTARDEIDRVRVARLKGVGDPLDGHARLAQLKTAAVLAIWDGRFDLTDDDWHLAGIIHAISDRTRSHVVERLAEVRATANRARGTAEGERAALVSDTLADHNAKRVALFLKRHLAGGEWVAGAPLRRRLASRDRRHFDEAIERLIKAGQVEPGDAGNVGPEGTLYRLAGGAS